MKKYNLSKIMKRAWELVKRLRVTMSAALKRAWCEAKAAAQKISFKGFAKVLKADCVGGSESDYFTYSKWEKHGKNRIYVNDYKGRSVGYIDLLGGNVIHTENYIVEHEIKSFMEQYAI